MKFLITFYLLLLSVYGVALAQTSPEQRRLDARAETLKDATPSFCLKYPAQLRGDCQSAVVAELKKQLPKQAKIFISDLIAQSDAKVNAEIREENAIVRFTSLLSEAGIGNGDCTDSACLKSRYQDYLISIQPEPAPIEPATGSAPIGTATGS